MTRSGPVGTVVPVVFMFAIAVAPRASADVVTPADCECNTCMLGT